jgi:mRNA interferase RelE/StbE
MKYAVQIKKSVLRALNKLPKNDRERVDEHIRSLADNPRPPGAVPLKGSGKGIWRVRVGDRRVLYQIQDDVLLVLVVDVAHRREVYRGL